MRGGTKIVVFHLVWFLCIHVPPMFSSNVTYDHKALLIDGKRRVLVSGSIHYPRSTPEMWPDLIQKSKDGGLDVIETYVFWNLHEPVRGQEKQDFMYIYVLDLMLVLNGIMGIKFRTDNQPFKAEMQRFTAKIVDMIKQENLYVSQGGPIILSQIENEYGNIDGPYGAAGKSYIKWAASMATSLNTGVPWVMCQQADAPDPIINTCNGFYCDQFTPNSNAKPKMWTENWSGWFLAFGGAVPYRPVEDLAFAVARFYQRGGTFQNYYMYHGGTNFGRSSGGPFISTSYDYDAPIDEYGIIRQPKWGHLKDLHKAIKLCEEALIATDPTITSLASNLEVAVYKSGGVCAAFLANIGTSDATAKFNGNSYQLPAWSVSILPDCKNVVLNTAKINSASTTSSFASQSLEDSSSGWSWISEPIGISKKDSFSKFGLVEQINTTADKSDYLWYSLSIDFEDDVTSQTVLHIESLGHALHAFINGKLAGSGKGNSGNAKVNVDIPITLVAGKNTIDLLSLTVGLQNYGSFFDTWGAGITGPVTLKGLKNGTTIDLSSQQWTYQIGLQGEDLGLSSGSVGQWNSQSNLPKNQPLTWYKTNFVAPSGNDLVAIDFTGMGKGEAWVNGQSIGRYWPTYVSPNSGCATSCNYRGSYSSSKCLKNCGNPSQTLYHVPRSWLKTDSNTLVLFEESGGDPTKISLATKQIGSLCSQVSEIHPPPIDMWNSDSESGRRSGPVLSLDCPNPKQVISSIKFASFGTPTGTCGNFNHGSCSSNKALSIVEKACIGSRSCKINVSIDTFGDPCRRVTKSLAVEALFIGNLLKIKEAAMSVKKIDQFILFLLFLAIYAPAATFCANVTYDHRALIIDGSRRVLLSGSIHYPRSTPEMWPDLIQKSKDGGIDVIETYVFWNLHEPIRGQYNFEGRRDLVKFVKLVAAAGLYVHLRIGPYVCAEWNYGGFPIWLHFIPGIKFRTDNEAFKAEMKRFTTKIVNMMKEESLYASQGGPIILSQIENEYGDVDSAYGPAAKPYINWAASMATSLDTGVPWVMCMQADAPNPIINTCNGFYCDQFTPNSNAKPKIWTEGYNGWFLYYGGAVPYRPVEDLAFAVARFYQLGGTFMNYYMYHGGTNFGRTTGGPFVATSYDYDAPLDEYGIIRQPKWGHLKDLHNSIKLCEEALIATDPAVTSLGPYIEVAVYKTDDVCAAFLANTNTTVDLTVNFSGDSYQLPAWSVSILPDCKNVVFNSAKINSASAVSIVRTESLKQEVGTSESDSSGWSWISEPIGISKNESFSKFGLLEQINNTADRSDYFWYSLSIDLEDDDDDAGSQTVLHIESLGHALHAFINGNLAGNGTGNSTNAAVIVDIPITLVNGKNTIDLLSLTVGLQNFGAFFDTWGAGITGPVTLKGLKNGTTIDLSSQQWTYQVGLLGEDLGLPSGSAGQWNSQSTLPKNQSLTWYKTNFVTPSGNDPVAIDFTGMGKGEAWVNGQSIGRYWPTYVSPNSGCTNSCDYRGYYYQSKCLRNCGKPSQTLYHVPRSWLKSDSSNNTLVLFEESGGDPTRISFVTKQIGSVCSYVSESHPPPIEMWRKSGPVLSLECPYPNQVISSIKFASFGTPYGACGSFNHGSCSSSIALYTVQKACIGSRRCNINVSVNTFGDPCRGVTKSLAVEASCNLD
ncbi:Beta-galactosidase 8 [Stylosanthes scabra]|uniref:Beta-galactosidase n=1 Tax=Stylosanthes scabra TaxID=79078 RepID=A0ABU6RDP2_9FABA|nr:Beta-galactosidase 8 [Stylosanthes scabra]